MLEAHVDTIREEMRLLALLTDVGSRSAHDATLVSRGCWSEHVLLTGGGSSVVHHANRCPRTTALLLRIPALVGCVQNGIGEAIFSVLAPKTHLRPHCASSNLRLTCHLPLVVPAGGCRLRCGDETRPWVDGKCLCFDDSFEHEVRASLCALLCVWLAVCCNDPGLCCATGVQRLGRDAHHLASQLHAPRAACQRVEAAVRVTRLTLLRGRSPYRRHAKRRRKHESPLPARSGPCTGGTVHRLLRAAEAEAAALCRRRRGAFPALRLQAHAFFAPRAQARLAVRRVPAPGRC